MTGIFLAEYDYEQLRIEYLADNGSWVEIPTATMSYTFDMPPDENGTQIYGTETAVLNVVRYGTLFKPPIEPGDKVRLRYGSYVWPRQFYVDKTSTKWSRSDQPKILRYEFQASMVGVYATALTRVVSYPDLPKESAYKRMSRFVTIRNLSIINSESEVED